MPDHVRLALLACLLAEEVWMAQLIASRSCPATRLTSGSSGHLRLVRLPHLGHSRHSLRHHRGRQIHRCLRV
jgi:hypothetical protein